MVFECTVDRLSSTSRCLDRSALARRLPGMPGVARPMCRESPSSSPAPFCLAPHFRSRRSPRPDAFAQAFRSQDDSAPSRIPTTAGAGCPSLDCAARQRSTTFLCLCQLPASRHGTNGSLPCFCSSTGVCKSCWSLKKSHRPWSGVPVTSCSILTGLGNRCFAKSFSLTDNVCLGRRPVALTAELPLSLLLSRFHRAGDVEKRAHWTDGTRKDSTVSCCTNARLGRSNREECIVAMASVWAVLADAGGRSRVTFKVAGNCDRGRPLAHAISHQP